MYKKYAKWIWPFALFYYLERRHLQRVGCSDEDVTSMPDYDDIMFGKKEMEDGFRSEFLLNIISKRTEFKIWDNLKNTLLKRSKQIWSKSSANLFIIPCDSISEIVVIRSRNLRNEFKENAEFLDTFDLEQKSETTCKNR